MKTMTLVFGVAYLAAAACSAVGGFHYHATWVIVLMVVCGGANAYVGVTKCLDALFGDGGLVLDVGRRIDRDTAGDDHKVGPRFRGARMSHPSAALRHRGAHKRLRNCRAWN